MLLLKFAIDVLRMGKYDELKLPYQVSACIYCMSTVQCYMQQFIWDINFAGKKENARTMQKKLTQFVRIVCEFS